MSRFGIKKRDDEVTVDSLRTYFPTKRDTITQALADTINDIQTNPEAAVEGFMENLVEFKNVIDKTQASMKEYVRAMKFCAFLEYCNFNILEAYKMSRSDDKFVKDRWDAPTDSPKYKDLTSAASRYHKSALVRQILLQADMPMELMFMGAKYKAMNVLITEMETAAYSRDRISAAKEVLVALKRNDTQKVELAIGLNEETMSFQEMLTAKVSELAALQLRRLESGENISTVQKLEVSINTADVIEAQITNG